MQSLDHEDTVPTEVEVDPEENSDSDFETDEEIDDFVDPRKPIDCWDRPFIDCITKYSECRTNFQTFCTQDCEPTNNPPNAKKTIFKLFCIAFYYAPIIYFLTSYYPQTE